MTISVLYDSFILNSFKGEIVLHTDTFKIMLVNDYTFDPEHTSLSDLADKEIDPTSVYNAGGNTLTNTLWEYDEDSSSWIFSADNLLFTIPDNETLGPMNGAVIYKYNNSTNPLCLFIDFEGIEEFDETSVFQIILEADGIFKLTKGT